MCAPIDWPGYLRVHSDRRNLAIHAIAVPLFVASTVVLVVSPIGGAYVTAIVASSAAIIAMVLQARGHALEPHAPEPFTGPANFLRRWFTEQFLIFPLFVVTGRWWRQFKTSGGGSGRAA